MGSVIIRIGRRQDREVIKRLNKIITTVGIVMPPNNATYVAGASSRSSQFSLAAPDDEATLHQLLELKSYACQTINVTLGNSFSLSFNRPNESAFDTITVNNSSQNPQFDIQAAKLLPAFEKEFDVYNTTAALSQLFPDQVQAFQEGREAILGRLQELTETIIHRNEEYRVELDHRATVNLEKLRVEAAAERNAQNQAHQANLAKLAVREDALSARIKEIDARESRTARRGIRKELQEELKSRSERFQLTKGTRLLRAPIHIACVATGLFLGTMAGINLFYGLRLLTETPPPSFAQIITFSTRQFILTGGFLGILSYYIRWTNQWFSQHAREEFRLKRLGIDIDWANWIVETAMEWQQEIKSEIPAELLARLTANLFAEEKEKQEPLNPADQLASALLGSSASATVDVPGGKISFDRKGLKNLAEDKKD